MAARLFLRLCNAIFNCLLAAALLLCGAYAGYALWDNNQILTAAGNVQADMLKLKPEITQEEPQADPSAAFDQLLKINPDVCGWISMDSTRIDFPVLQGPNNMHYINTDVYGNFSLAGSIFLDTRCDRSFTDSYSLLYGHHMAGGNMFGDLDLYKDTEFFKTNTTGRLILPDKVYNLETICCMLVNASDDCVFEPESMQHDISGLLDYAEKQAVQLSAETLRRARETESVQIIALSTCSSEFTDARTIVLAVMDADTTGGTGGEKNVHEA